MFIIALERSRVQLAQEPLEKGVINQLFKQHMHSSPHLLSFRSYARLPRVDEKHINTERPIRIQDAVVFYASAIAVLSLKMVLVVAFLCSVHDTLVATVDAR